MAREAEAEAWVRKPKRIIHNQTLIQLLTILAIATPLPLAALVFWGVFASAIVVQSVVALWAVSAVIYIALAVYARIRQRNP